MYVMASDRGHKRPAPLPSDNHRPKPPMRAVSIALARPLPYNKKGGHYHYNIVASRRVASSRVAGRHERESTSAGAAQGRGETRSISENVLSAGREGGNESRSQEGTFAAHPAPAWQHAARYASRSRTAAAPTTDGRGTYYYYIKGGEGGGGRDRGGQDEVRDRERANE